MPCAHHIRAEELGQSARSRRIITRAQAVTAGSRPWRRRRIGGVRDLVLRQLTLGIGHTEILVVVGPVLNSLHVLDDMRRLRMVVVQHSALAFDSFEAPVVRCLATVAVAEKPIAFVPPTRPADQAWIVLEAQHRRPALGVQVLDQGEVLAAKPAHTVHTFGGPCC